MIVKEVLRTRSGGQQTIMMSFGDYCDNLKSDLFKILGDIESVCEVMTGQPRSDWTERETAAFERIRTRLLNVAGSISRLPTSLE